MAHDKPVALIKSSSTGKIFDVDNMLRVLEYSPNLWQTTLEHDLPALTEHIRGAWDNRDSQQTYMKLLRSNSGSRDFRPEATPRVDSARGAPRAASA